MSSMTAGYGVLIQHDEVREDMLPERTGRVSAIILLTCIFLILPAGFGLPVYHGSGNSSAFAAEERAPYGNAGEGEYGEKRAVSTKDEARKILRDYFSGKKNAKIGKISEKALYFEAEILDDRDKVIDVVIVDKRTGRIRSIY
jgi:hypothetical protein